MKHTVNHDNTDASLTLSRIVEEEVARVMHERGIIAPIEVPKDIAKGVRSRVEIVTTVEVTDSDR